MVQKKLIKNNNEIVSLTFEEVVQSFDGLSKKFARNCVKEMNYFDIYSYYSFDDYYELALSNLYNCFNSYDTSKDANFSTYFIGSLKNQRKDLIKNANRKKSIPQAAASMDCEMDNGLSYKEILADTNALKDFEIDEKDISYVEYLKDEFTNGELLILISNIKKEDIKKNSNIRFLHDVLLECTDGKDLLKKELCEELGCSHPTLQRKSKKLEEKLKNLTLLYFKRNVDF